METTAQNIANRIYILDGQIAALRTELKDLKEERGALVDTLTGVLGTDAEVQFTTQEGRLTASPKPFVIFPTQASDPEKQRQLIASVRAAGQWDHFSMLCYPRLKSEWLSRSPLADDLRDRIAPFATESIKLKVTTGGRRSKYLAGRSIRTTRSSTTGSKPIVQFRRSQKTQHPESK